MRDYTWRLSREKDTINSENPGNLKRLNFSNMSLTLI